MVFGFDDGLDVVAKDAASGARHHDKGVAIGLQDLAIRQGGHGLEATTQCFLPIRSHDQKISTRECSGGRP